MRIGLVDVDGHNFPNLPLMKISAWHKQQGDTVEFASPLNGHYDKIYASKVFTFTHDDNSIYDAKEFVFGGTGYGLESKLPQEIEHIYPDYDLYGVTDTAYGFLTRGCPRNCGFCIVSKKEGLKSHKVADLSEFWRGQKHIKLLDPNLLACKEHKYDLLQQLVDSKAWIDITQGLDIRLMDDTAIDLIKQIKLKMIHFAWDNIEDSIIIVEKLKEFKSKTGINERKARVYVLTNYNSDLFDDLSRIYTLRKLGYDPYIMIYDKEKAGKELKQMARWVNNKFIWRKCEKFEDYIA